MTLLKTSSYKLIHKHSQFSMIPTIPYYVLCGKEKICQQYLANYKDPSHIIVLINVVKCILNENIKFSFSYINFISISFIDESQFEFGI